MLIKIGEKYDEFSTECMLNNKRKKLASKLVWAARDLVYKAWIMDIVEASRIRI